MHYVEFGAPSSLNPKTSKKSCGNPDLPKTVVLPLAEHTCDVGVCSVVLFVCVCVVFACVVKTDYRLAPVLCVIITEDCCSTGTVLAQWHSTATVLP